MATDEDLINEWENEMIFQNRSASTIDLYLTIAHRFSNFLDGVGKRLTTAETKDVIAFINSLSVSNSSKRTYRAALMSLSKAQQKNGVELGTIPNIKQTHKELPKVLTKDQIDTVVQLCNTLRDKVIVRIAYEAALRVGECSRLVRGDIDLTDRTIMVRAEKGGTTMKVPIIDGNTLLLLTTYMKNTGGGDESPLFPSKRGGELEPSSMSSMFRKVCTQLGLNYTFHSLRHSRATHLIKDGADIYTVSKLLRHKSIDTTTVYVHLANEDLRNKLASTNSKLGSIGMAGLDNLEEMSIGDLDVYMQASDSNNMGEGEKESLQTSHED